jgi:hypothetical protein
MNALYRLGVLHVADHYVSAGKKQPTWSHSDFGHTRDRNLTNQDCFNIELMTGLHTDNQPSFNWLVPCEGKPFTQHFLSYWALGIMERPYVPGTSRNLGDRCIGRQLATGAAPFWPFLLL